MTICAVSQYNKCWHDRYNKYRNTENTGTKMYILIYGVNKALIYTPTLNNRDREGKTTANISFEKHFNVSSVCRPELR